MQLQALFTPLTAHANAMFICRFQGGMQYLCNLGCARILTATPLGGKGHLALECVALYIFPCLNVARATHIFTDDTDTMGSSLVWYAGADLRHL